MDTVWKIENNFQRIQYFFENENSSVTLFRARSNEKAFRMQVYSEIKKFDFTSK